MSRAIPVVVVAFNRADSLSRLLKSLNNAIYEQNNIPLIISIDKGENKDVLDVAEAFVWEHGNKQVVYQKENLKLRKHILTCGDYALQYGNVIILEDDLIVSPFYYEYILKALEFTSDDNRIGGISLYNHRYNVVAFEPFEILDDSYDNWYLQFASSWGQAWTKHQWKEFKEWYAHDPQIDDREEVPAYVRSWPASSWLKYFTSFLIEKDKYFIYPKKSLTTNFGEAGTHIKKSNTDYQVILQREHIDFIFSKIDESECVYDAYFESIYLKRKFKEISKSVIIDLYGSKRENKICNDYDYILTRQILPYQIVEQYACHMRPHEENIIRDIRGNDFFLYDLGKKSENKSKFDGEKKVRYNLRFIDVPQYKYVLRMFLNKMQSGIQRRYRKFKLK